jgi:nucleotide-binding universal stress UspA family protein
VSSDAQDGQRGSEDDAARVVLGYDGSEQAKRAIERLARMTPRRRRDGRDGVEARRAAARRAAVTGPPAGSDPVRELDERAEADAESVAANGVEFAQGVGLQATAQSRRGEHSEWATILQVAEDRAANVVVVGSRGRSALRSVLMGSVSNGVLHHSNRPVLIVQ